MTIAIAFSVPSLQTYAPLISLYVDESAWMLQSVALFGELATNDDVSWDVHGDNTMCSCSYFHSIELPLSLSVEQLSCTLCFPTTNEFWGFFVNRPNASEIVHKYKHWYSGLQDAEWPVSAATGKRLPAYHYHLPPTTSIVQRERSQELAQVWSIFHCWWTASLEKSTFPLTCLWTYLFEFHQLF